MRRRIARLLLPAAVAAAALVLPGAAALAAEDAPSNTPPGTPDYSAAERLLLMDDQLSALLPRLPLTLGYRFERRGRLDAAFAEPVGIAVAREADGSCCHARGDFLAGEHRVDLPEVDHARGNPVVLYFLEHDIRDLNRRTRGSVAYFRKRIRMALYEAARIDEVAFVYQGRRTQGRRITIEPYLNDPQPARLREFLRRRYVFVLSAEVPGGIAAMQAGTPAADVGAGTEPLLLDELRLDGVELGPPA